MSDRAAYYRSWYRKNKAKVQASVKKWRIANPEKYARTKWAAQLRIKYGITLSEYVVMLNRQNGLCAICGRPPRTKHLAVDHCHATKIVRGLLCHLCNMNLGHVETWMSNFSLQIANYLGSKREMSTPSGEKVKWLRNSGT